MGCPPISSPEKGPCLPFTRSEGFLGWVPVLGACHLHHLPGLPLFAVWTSPGTGWTCRIPRATSVVQLESAIFRISENSTPQLWRIRAPGSKDINPDSQASSVRGHPQDDFLPNRKLRAGSRCAAGLAKLNQSKLKAEIVWLSGVRGRPVSMNADVPSPALENRHWAKGVESCLATTHCRSEKEVSECGGI